MSAATAAATTLRITYSTADTVVSSVSWQRTRTHNLFRHVNQDRLDKSSHQFLVSTHTHTHISFVQESFSLEMSSAGCMQFSS